MNGAHLHLLVNHVPLFGIAFGLAALIWATVRKSDEMRWGALALFLLAGLCGWIAVESGESAEQLAEHLPGVTKALIESHSDAAELANIGASILAISAILMEIVARFRRKSLMAVQIAVVVLAVFATALMARAANFGGQVRHTEIRPGAENIPSAEGAREK